ncbi:MAG TPA: hypothetical protein VHD81_05285 [Mycobacteriales bacterium]|nr:hypothetical protein [Mycobacteriales bacterium]
MSGISRLKCLECEAVFVLGADGVASAAHVATFATAHVHDTVTSKISFEITAEPARADEYASSGDSRSR